MTRIQSMIRGMLVSLVPMAVVLSAQVIQAQVNVTTYHNDNARTGVNLSETILTPDNVNVATFGRLFTQIVDGNALAQPLYLSNVDIPDVGRKNVVFVATERDSIYAFDADSNQGPSKGLLWHTELFDSTSGVTWVPEVAGGRIGLCCCCDDIVPDIGITATPVIDAEGGFLYTVTKTKEIRGDERHYVQTLYKLDVATGNQLGRFIIGDTTVSGTTCGNLVYSYDSFGPTVMGSERADASTAGGIIHFNAVTSHQRSGLVLNNGVVYVVWSSHCDRRPYHGWVMGFDANDLHLLSWFNTTPGTVGSTFSSWGGGIWMGGGAPAVDGGGNLFFTTGNGRTGEDPANFELGETVVRLTSDLDLGDYFVPWDLMSLDQADADLGSGGVLLLPDQKTNPPRLLVTGGKRGRVFLIDRDVMGGFQACGPTCNQVVQSFRLETANRDILGTPALFQDFVYIGASGDNLKAYRLVNGRLEVTPSSRSRTSFGNKGVTASISANGDQNGIAWVTEVAGLRSPAVLRAYDALDLTNELYNSGPEGLTPGSKFSLPTIANGKVYVGLGRSTETDFGVLAVFGLLQGK